MELRLKTASEEMKHAGGFDYQVENRDNSLDEAVAAIDSIITSERRRDGRTPLRLL